VTLLETERKQSGGGNEEMVKSVRMAWGREQRECPNPNPNWRMAWGREQREWEARESILVEEISMLKAEREADAEELESLRKALNVSNTSEASNGPVNVAASIKTGERLAEAELATVKDDLKREETNPNPEPKPNPNPRMNLRELKRHRGSLRHLSERNEESF